MPTLKPSRIRVLYVSTPQGHAGALIKDSRHSFTYAPEILEPAESQRAISLTMPLRAAPWLRTTMLPAFQTFLPEGFLRERITEKLGKAMRVDDMALLAFSGENAIGRLRVSASRDASPDAGTRESLAEIMAHQGARDLFEYLCDRYLISSGIAGVQPKVVVPVDAPDATPFQASVIKPSIGEKSTLRARQLIVKVAGADYPNLAVNEFNCMSIARACGADLIETPPFWLSEDGQRMAIERFDIDPASGRYLGFEDMVSLQGKVNEEKYEGSYESIALAIRRNGSAPYVADSLRRLFALVVLSVVLRNGDAHLKNFGLVYTDPTSDDCRLAPAYDLVNTTVYLPKDVLALKLGGTKAWPDRARLETFGRGHCDLVKPGLVIARVIEAAAGFRPRESDAFWIHMREQIERGAAALA